VSFRFPAALALAIAAACGSGGGSSAPDAGVAACDPLAQTGCAGGEKCTVILPAGDGNGATDCVADGSVGEGEPCALTERADGTRVDDCAGPLVCGPEQVCTPPCVFRERGSCGEQATCVRVNRYFEDVAGTNVGLCVPQCDPLDPAATCSPGRGCYPFFPTSEFLCAQPAGGAAELGFMDECQPQSSPGTCFLNSAPIGAVSFLALDYNLQAENTPRVSPFCRAVSTHSGSGDPATTAAGDPTLRCGPGLLGSGGAQCRHVNSLYANPELALIGDGVGLCVPTGVSVPTGSNYNDSVTFDLAAWSDNPAGPLNPDGVPFCPGCLTRSEFDAALGGALALDAVLPLASPETLDALLSLAP
jgi:hypothetical protein